MSNVIYEIRRSFVSYPFSDKPDERVEEAKEICKDITNHSLSLLPGCDLNKAWTSAGLCYPVQYAELCNCPTELIDDSDRVIVRIPFSPHLIFPQCMCEDVVGRDAAMAFCFALLHSCDEILFGSKTLSAGMREELHEAIRIGKLVVFYDDIR